MLGAQRKTHLLDILSREGRVVAKSVARQLGVSDDSIRRDLRELADAGRVIRVYGGALPVPAADRPVGERRTLATASKERVARRAAELIRPGSTIVLDAGTTTLAMTRLLPHGANLTVITPSPTIALAVADHSEARVIIIGGELDRYSSVAGGALAMEAIRHIAADTFFLGVTGVDPEQGLTTGSLDDAVTKRAITERCADTIVLASEEKIGAVSRFPVIGFDAVTEIISDPHDQNSLIPELMGRITGRQ
ncbi:MULTISPECIES: DeoR/GlpR family DNA-binding transcription regulator [unclassified Microbacterium]|uniref:DeoR/GlpR family DNA-binding transcription regulator n=1 Tax=unclassified Microbacterium TaxID=2609290 RepID=UPI000EA85C50|nr:MULTISPECIES: DeoR/GlpR family DNA-binding transcription regulator [unclassified Microbacterium]MBT2483960.1 DeoR/GlpR transcriptional regulator [Microbacterium sp. ISL-108]RKN66927.1 DeoR/GlpR transcriptional regulator [Microbacterium sp. CGR2]